MIEHSVTETVSNTVAAKKLYQQLLERDIQMSGMNALLRLSAGSGMYDATPCDAGVFAQLLTEWDRHQSNTKNPVILGYLLRCMEDHEISSYTWLYIILCHVMTLGPVKHLGSLPSWAIAAVVHAVVKTSFSEGVIPDRFQESLTFGDIARIAQDCPVTVVQLISMDDRKTLFWADALGIDMVSLELVVREAVALGIGDRALIAELLQALS